MRCLREISRQGFLVSLLIASACSAVGEPAGQQARQHYGDGFVELTSLVALLADPQRFDGRIVHTIGYLGCDPLALYVGVGDVRYQVSTNGVFLNLKPNLRTADTCLEAKPVIVIGRFRGSPDSPIAFRYGIEGVMRMDAW